MSKQEDKRTELTKKIVQAKPILKLDNDKARKFFLRSESYCTLDVPKYLDFSYTLEQCCLRLRDGNYNYKSLCPLDKSPKNYDSVNYTIFTNKDGKFAWRKLELIHPILYVALVNLITEKKNWKTLKNRFEKFKSSCKNVECCSLPIVPYGDETQKAEAIKNWSKNFTKKSVSLAIDFKYMAALDITDCYGSIYTHSISWAIYGKSEIKKNIKNGCKNSQPLEKIDRIIEDMSFGQTNGIPQGSILMDLIAELVLGYVDTKIQEKIRENSSRKCQQDENGELQKDKQEEAQQDEQEKFYKLSAVKILRFRDDYKIFSNDTKTLQEVMRLISETLSEFNFKLNTEKTFISSDIVIDSQKPDKLEWKSIEKTIINSNLSLFNKLTQIKYFANKYPNSGSLKSALSKLYKFKIHGLSKKPQDFEAIVAIVVSIMMENPSVQAHGAAILSKLFSFLDKDEAIQYVIKIRKMFSSIPNSMYLELWLQRITIFIDPDYRDYESKICKIIQGANEELWESSWLKQGKMQDGCSIFVGNTLKDALKDIPQVIPPKEVDAFGHGYQSD